MAEANGGYYVEQAKRQLDESMTGMDDPGYPERCIARAQVNATLAVALEIRFLRQASKHKEQAS